MWDRSSAHKGPAAGYAVRTIRPEGSRTAACPFTRTATALAGSNPARGSEPKRVLSATLVAGSRCNPGSRQCTMKTQIERRCTMK